MPTFERVTLLPFVTKSFDVATGELVGVASTPQVDRMGEVVSAEAMQEAAERYMRNPIVTWQHDTNEPVGRGLEVQVTDAGTLLRAYVTDKTDCGRKVRGLLEDGIVRSLSIGFNPYSRSYGPSADGAPDYERAGDLLTWKRIDWLETAICAIPCNPGATIQLAKSLGLNADLPREQTKDEAEEERFLQDMERVRTGAESVQNIHRHWQKEGRILTAEHRLRLAEARDILAGVLEPYPTPGEEPAPQGALSLPQLPDLALPTPQGTPLP